MDYPYSPDKKRCAAAVWRRDTYRRTGRTKSGFELHYTMDQCKRKATHGKYCKQHAEYENEPAPPVKGIVNE